MKFKMLLVQADFQIWTIELSKSECDEECLLTCLSFLVCHISTEASLREILRFETIAPSSVAHRVTDDKYNPLRFVIY